MHSPRPACAPRLCAQCPGRAPAAQPALPRPRACCRSPAYRARASRACIPSTRAARLPRARLLLTFPAPASPAPARSQPSARALPAQRPCACLRAQQAPARAPTAQPLLYRGLAGHCIAIQSSLALAPQLQYIFFVLQYKFPA